MINRKLIELITKKDFEDPSLRDMMQYLRLIDCTFWFCMAIFSMRLKTINT